MSLDDAYERRREIGRRVARWRARRGLNRRQFADLCDRSLSWVDKVESGERGLLRLPMLERVAEVLHVSVETLTDTTEVRQARHCLDLFEISATKEKLGYWTLDYPVDLHRCCSSTRWHPGFRSSSLLFH